MQRVVTDWQMDALAGAIHNQGAELAALRRDAERYRWLRAQHWYDNNIAAVRRPKDAMKLGHDAPSGDRLDALIDEAMRERA